MNADQTRKFLNDPEYLGIDKLVKVTDDEYRGVVYKRNDSYCYEIPDTVRAFLGEDFDVEYFFEGENGLHKFKAVKTRGNCF